MGQTNIGSTNLKLGVDAKGAQAGLAEFKQRLTTWADGTQKQLRAQFQAGFMGGLIGGSLTGLVQEGVESLVDWARGTKEIQARMESVALDIKAAKNAQDEAAKSAEKWRDGLGRGESMDSMRAEIESLTNEYHRLMTMARELNAAPGNTWVLKWGGEANAIANRITGLTDKLEDLEKFQPIVAVRKEVEKLREEMALAGLSGDALVDAQLRLAGATKGANAELDREIEKLRELRMKRDTGSGALAGAFGPLGAMLGRGATALLPQNPPPWLGFALNVANKVGDASKNAKDFAMKEFDNPALRRGSAAELSARSRFEMGGQQRDQLAEAKKATAHLDTLNKTAKELPAQLAAALALSAL